MYSRFKMLMCASFVAMGLTPLASMSQSVGSPARGEFQAWRGAASPAYPTKDALIAAVKRGELAGIDNIRGPRATEETKPIIASIAAILDDEYKTPIPDDQKSGDCVKVMPHELLRVLQEVTRSYNDTLTTQPPEFRRRIVKWGEQARYDTTSPVAELVRSKLEWARVRCSQTMLGQKRPYPMVQSLQTLLEEYASASGVYVEEKRAAMIKDYQAREAAKQEAKDRQEAERRAADQQRIDAQRQRIEEQQRKQREADAKRISG